MKKIILLKMIILFLTFFNLDHVYSSSELNQETKGTELMKSYDERARGMISSSSDMKMILVDEKGKSVERQMTAKAIENDKTGDKSLMEFLRPLDIKGTKLLTWSKNSTEDNQWLYLPSQKKTKRINSSVKGSSFMGSEFTYEDLEGQDLDKFNFRWIAENLVDGDVYQIIERKSKDKSAYEKVILTMSEKYAQPLKVVYYNRRGELLKEAIMSDFKTYQVGSKNYFLANKVHVKNVQTKKESILEWSSRELGKNLNEALFSQNTLSQ